MRFAVIGSQGMFGSEMVLFLKSQGQQVQGFSRDNIDLDSSINEIARSGSSGLTPCSEVGLNGSLQR